MSNNLTAFDESHLITFKMFALNNLRQMILSNSLFALIFGSSRVKIDGLSNNLTEIDANNLVLTKLTV